MCPRPPNNMCFTRAAHASKTNTGALLRRQNGPVRNRKRRLLPLPPPKSLSTPSPPPHPLQHVLVALVVFTLKTVRSLPGSFRSFVPVQLTRNAFRGHTDQLPEKKNDEKQHKKNKGHTKRHDNNHYKRDSRAQKQTIQIRRLPWSQANREQTKQ